MKTAGRSIWDIADDLKRQEGVERMRHYGQVEQRRDRGIELVYQRANTPWKRAAAERLQQVIKTHDTFTSDDILIDLEQRGIVTGDTRALAAILKGAAKAGQIEATDNFIPTKRPSRHRAPIRVWRVIKRAA